MTSKKQYVYYVKQQLCTCIKHFCTFLDRSCTTTTWKCLIASFVEDLNKRRRISFSLYKVECALQEINSREIRPHLPFSANWNKRDSVWKTEIRFKSDVFTAVAVVDAKAPYLLEELCKRIQHCYATPRQARNKRNVGSCWFKRLTSSKLCSTTPNHSQPTGCANEHKM